MKSFNLYEFSGVLIPGTIILFGVSLCFPQLKGVLLTDISFGDFGIFIILAYASGQLVQAIGNLLEELWWRLQGGKPTDWIRKGQTRLLAKVQLKELADHISKKLGLKIGNDLMGVSESDWHNIIRQIYSYISTKAATERVDTFNAYYGLNRGMAAAFLLLLVLSLMLNLGVWSAVMMTLMLLSLYRMNRFGENYARELFIQFLNIE